MKLTLEVLTGDSAGRQWTLDDGELTVGRGEDQDVALGVAHVSSAHGKVLRKGDGYVFRDLFSTNGSRVVRADQTIELTPAGKLEIELLDGDDLKLGDKDGPIVVTIRIEDDAEDPRRVVAVRRLKDVPALTAGFARAPGRLQQLYGVSQRIARVLDLDGVLDATVAAVFELFPTATHLGVFLKEEGRFRRVVGRRADREGDEPLELSRSLSRQVLEDRAGVLASNAQSMLMSATIADAGIQSTMCVPLWRGDDIFGLVQVDNRTSAGTFGESDLTLLTVLAGQLSLAFANARLYRRVRLAEEAARKENRYLKRREKASAEPLGESPAWLAVMEAVAKVRDTRVPVCIVGETGTGKELVARATHYTGNRAERLFVAQNMAALPETILESELFGHKKGAFTGADVDKKGLFEIADGGTIFLDEIAEMPLPLQAKLLRVLQEGEIRPVGAPQPRSVDVRVISATNRNLELEVEEGRFREDLYYRLMVFPISLPPLRDRGDDITLLANRFLARYGKEFARPLPALSPNALRTMLSYAWPGNIRQLENEIQRLVIQGVSGDLIEPSDLSPALTSFKASASVPTVEADGRTLKQMMEAVERSLLTRALDDHGNNKSRTAETLGITREGLHKKLAKLGMTGPR